MYFIKKIILDDKQGYQSSKIVDHTSKTISVALSLLENAVRMFVKDECGREAADQIKIIDIYKFDQVNEPMIDSMLLYRLTDDPHRIHVYQKKTTVVKVSGYIWGTSDTPTTFFRRTHIFELEEYSGSISPGTQNTINIPNSENTNVPSILPQVEMVPIGPARIKIPKPMTLAPMCNLIDELKKSAKFKFRQDLVNSANAPLSAPDIRC